LATVAGHFIQLGPAQRKLATLYGRQVSTAPSIGLSLHISNLTQMAYAAASLTLNNRQRFRNFFRTMPVYTNMGISVAELAETFNWRQIAVVTESNGLFIPVRM